MRLAVSWFPPFLYRHHLAPGDGWMGSDVDLWRILSGQLHLDMVTVQLPTMDMTTAMVYNR